MESNDTPISFRAMSPGEESGVVGLVLKVFAEFVAPRYSDEGVAEFKKYVNVKALEDRFRSGNPILLAECGARTVGVIEMRDDCHVALLFVENAYQRQGIAKELVRRAIAVCRQRNRELKKVTVNSSPNAFDAYRRIGFTGAREEKTVNGICFIPMELALAGSDILCSP